MFRFALPVLALASSAALLAAAAPAVAQPFHLEDPLRGGTIGNAMGGAFGPDGWTVTDRTDRIWYAIPRMSRGSIEFTVTNMSSANLILGDHEIFAMYEDGYGMGEPINYNPEYRNNHYKAMIRISERWRSRRTASALSSSCGGSVRRARPGT